MCTHMCSLPPVCLFILLYFISFFFLFFLGCCDNVNGFIVLTLSQFVRFQMWTFVMLSFSREWVRKMERHLQTFFIIFFKSTFREYYQNEQVKTWRHEECVYNVHFFFKLSISFKKKYFNITKISFNSLGDCVESFFFVFCFFLKKY